MTELFKAIKQHNPQAIVSVSPNPQKFSLESYLLDWYRWERIGLIEELVLQVYRHNQESFVREISQPEVQTAKKHIPVGIGILSGLKGNYVPMERINTQVTTVREQGFAGVSFFFYESLWKMTEEPPYRRKSAFKQLFSNPVERPQLNQSQGN